MSRRWPAGLLALSLVLALASTGRCKPPDLPKYQTVTVLPNTPEIASDPNVLKAIGVFNAFPIQVLQAEDFADPSAPCGEEAPEVPEPKDCRRTPCEEPDASGECVQESGWWSFPAPRHGVVENLRRVREACEAMRKARELQQKGDHVGAIKCLQEARDSVAGSPVAGVMDEPLRCAQAHCAALGAAQQHAAGVAWPYRVVMVRKSGICAAGAGAKCASAGQATGNPQIVVATGANEGGCCLGQAVQNAYRVENAVRIEMRFAVGTGTRVVKAARSTMPCETCCAMAAHFDRIPLIAALDQMRRVTGCKVEIDFEGLHKAGVSPMEPVSLDVQGLPLYSALDLMLKPHHLQATIDDNTIRVSCTAECRNKVGTEAADPAACQDACPKCAAMHAKAVKAREQMAKKLMVDGLMKACRLAVVEGRYEKAAMLAREAHALDPASVEAEPMVIKLDLLGGSHPEPAAPRVRVLCPVDDPANGTEECEPTDGAAKLKPHLPGVFGDVVNGLEGVAAGVDRPKR